MADSNEYRAMEQRSNYYNFSFLFLFFGSYAFVKLGTKHSMHLNDMATKKYIILTPGKILTPKSL